MSVQRRNFPDSFKREAVDRVASSGLSVGAVARKLGLHETVLRSPSDLAADVARLRRENGQLRMERDSLKTAALIFGAASR